MYEVYSLKAHLAEHAHITVCIFLSLQSVFQVVFTGFLLANVSGQTCW